jgi:hypothetical protein
VLGLIVTLVFNTLGVWFQLDEARQSKDVSQLGLVTELNTIAQQSEEKINATDLPDKRCDGDQTGELRDREEAVLAAALKNYDYLAWLFARDHVTLGDANDYLAPAMIDAYQFGGVFIPAAYLARDYPNLKRFRDTRPKRLWPPDVCPP